MLVTQYLAKDLFAGKTVFVTGGGSGINLGVAKNFAALGANLAICGRTQEKLDAAAAELSALGANVCAVVADVRDFAALETAFVRSREALGSMDVLVCAGLSHIRKHLEEEFFVPSSPLELGAHGGFGIGVSARNIQCQASQDSQVRRSVVFSRPGEILVEDNVERPVQSILYAPMLAHDAKKFGRLVAARQQEVAFDLLVATTFAFDPRHPGEPRKVVLQSGQICSVGRRKIAKK